VGSATHAVCPDPVDFAFMDLDGNLCHDPMDSGDVGPQLASTTPFTPGAGSLVCSAPAIEFTVPSGQNVSWDVPGDVVLDCPTTFRGDSFYQIDVRAGGRILVNERDSSRGFHHTFLDAGDSIEINARVQTFQVSAVNDVTISAPGEYRTVASSAGSVFIGTRTRLQGARFIAAGQDIVFAERSGNVRKECCGTNLTAGGTVTLEERVKMTAREGSIVVEGQSVQIGDRVKLAAKHLDVAIEAVGTLDVVRLVAKATQDLWFLGGQVTLGAGTKLLAKDRNLRVAATGALAADGVKVLARDSIRIETEGTSLSFTNGLVKGLDVGTPLTIQTAPGGTCDVTGTKFVNVTPTFVDCTVVGGP
jgi:hypothetical protein